MLDNEQSTDLVVYADLETLGQVADEYAAHETFGEYQARRSANTLRRQHDDLTLFCTYLAAAGAARSPDDLFRDPEAWRGISAGLVRGFVTWQVQQGYAIASVNSRLATIKVYCKLAMDAGALSALALARLSLVKGYRHKEGRNVDREREVSRVGAKKALPTALNAGHAELLKRQPTTTKIGRRDRFMLYLFLELGLRCGELRDLERDNLESRDRRALPLPGKGGRGAISPALRRGAHRRHGLPARQREQRQPLPLSRLQGQKDRPGGAHHRTRHQ